MKGFFTGNRGAVTVIVTLLLIPAVLISGTGVDIARIYTARATLQDANQLALNSVLADYDALLQDLYGLYAVTQSDAVLGDMVNEYVKKTVLATDSEVPEEEGTGVLKLFYGTEPKTTLSAGESQNLGDIDQLRRQIEEYAKIRVPVVLVNELLDRLDEFSKVKADAVVIDKKTEVENRIDSIDEIYRQIYDGIVAVSGFKEYETQLKGDVYDGLVLIYKQFDEMKKVRTEFEELTADPDTSNDTVDLLKDHYDDLALNVVGIASGPTYGTDWEEDIENPSQGDFKSEEIFDLGAILSDGSKTLKKDSKLADELNTLCQKANDEKEDLEREIRELEDELDKGECSDTLKDGLTKPADGEEKSLLEQYKDIVRFDVGHLGNEYIGSGGNQLDALKNLLDEIENSNTYFYIVGNENTGVSFTFGFLKDYTRILNEFDMNYKNAPSATRGPDKLDRATKSSYPLQVLNDNYKNFQQTSEDHQKFYEMLESMYGGGSSGSKKEKKDKEDNVKGNILAVFNAMKDMFSEIIPNPEGAHKYTSNTNTSKAPTGSDFCSADSDWGDTTKVKKSLQGSLNSDIISKMGNIASSAADKLLLLGYATEMFSCYSTGRGEDKSPTNMAGIPLSTDVNYYYQSELEYIYNGNLSDAIDNVNSLGSMILLTRFVLNYIVAFTIKSVNDIVKAVRSALAFLGPVAIAIAELARLGLALGESLTDLSRLRSGHRVALLKDKETWRFSLTGLADMTKEAAKEAAKKQVKDSGEGDSDILDDKEGVGLYYFDYVRIFLLFVNGDNMAERVKNLIALNMTNKTKGIGANKTPEEMEQAMAAVELYDMTKARTGFTLTASADVSMLFLSMPLAQNAIEGVVPPKSLTLQVTDYRGY